MLEPKAKVLHPTVFRMKNDKKYCIRRERGRGKKRMDQGMVFRKKKKLKLSKMLNLVSNNFKVAIIDYYNYV